MILDFDFINFFDITFDIVQDSLTFPNNLSSKLPSIIHAPAHGIYKEKARKVLVKGGPENLGRGGKLNNQWSFLKKC